VNAAQARQLLRNFDFHPLFIEELGWDRHNSVLEITVPGSSVTLSAIAQKRGMVAYHCPPIGQRLPDYAQRRKIEHQVSKAAHEHLIIFTDPGDTTQIWQWVKRELGKPAACREHTFHSSQPGDALLQKLEAIAFSLDEEDTVSLTDVTRRARAGFDLARVTRRFYDEFQSEHLVFLKFISGIPEGGDREWYASVMLNRLMFIYFMQRKGFLDRDRNYLRNRLIRCRNEKGHDKFYSFYRYFLLRLFHEGLGGRERNADLERLLGQIPYLNGGIFDVHELERSDRYGNSIEIPDEAFEHIFDYFDRYQWHLDERPLRADDEINPDVLGYIFEKYINKKQMGAYYTKEDITGYISKNTVLPFLLDAARSKCKIAFENPNGPTVWGLLRGDPDRYIYPALRHGVSWDVYANGGKGAPLETPRALPPDIAEGMDTAKSGLIERRRSWNKPAPDEYALPTEFWREVVGRRERYEGIRQQLAAGDIDDTNEPITLNLDLHQFTLDAIENCEGPELLRAFWHAIERVTILDPTCGSGAFLFSALNVLEPLYEACLDRMERFVEDLSRSREKHRPERLSDFRKVLGRVAAHPNRRYFIFKSIVLNNLFGVDIMEEAVEICKLRLFLKLAAQVEPDHSRDNIGIEPLPDIDFNIRAGNTLVGYATYDEVKRAATSKLDFANVMDKIALKAADLQQAFDAFRGRQIDGDGSVPIEDKQELRKRLKALDGELNCYLAGEYGFEEAKKDSYAKWLKSHQPFHWFIEFYGIMSGGGFDVIIGNPPYVELSKVIAQYQPRNFATESCGNLYALCTERSFAIQHSNSRFGFIVQQPVTSTIRMAPCRRIVLQNSAFVWSSTYDDRPSKLFNGMHHARVAIIMSRRTAQKSRAAVLCVTAYNKWFKEEREYVFERLGYVAVPPEVLPGLFPKISTASEIQIIKKLHRRKERFDGWLSNTKSLHKLFYKITGVGSWFTITPRPPKFFRNGVASSSTRESEMTFSSEQARDRALCILNSTLFYWFYQTRTNCRDFNPSDYRTFPVPSSLGDEDMSKLARELGRQLDSSAEIVGASHSITGAIRYEQFRPRTAKSIIDEIDRVLARNYRFAEEELDFIINYDIKYRTGRNTEREDE
jgi:hypothetical protein